MPCVPVSTSSVPSTCLRENTSNENHACTDDWVVTRSAPAGHGRPGLARPRPGHSVGGGLLAACWPLAGRSARIVPSAAGRGPADRGVCRSASQSGGWPQLATVRAGRGRPVIQLPWSFCLLSLLVVGSHFSISGAICHFYWAEIIIATLFSPLSVHISSFSPPRRTLHIIEAAELYRAAGADGALSTATPAGSHCL